MTEKNGKVTRAVFFWVLGGLVSIFLIVGGGAATWTYNAYSEGVKLREQNVEAKYCTKDRATEINNQVIVLQQDVKHIKLKTDKIEVQNEKILETLRRMERGRPE